MKSITHYPVLLPDGTTQDNTITVELSAPGTGEVHHHRPVPVRPEFKYVGGTRERIN